MPRRSAALTAIVFTVLAPGVSLARAQNAPAPSAQAPAAQAATQTQGKSTRFGVKAILMLPGEAYVEEVDSYFDIDMSFGIGGMVDTRLGEKLLGGAFLDLTNVSAYDETALMFEAGVALKAALGGGSGLSWRPGIGVAYGRLASVDQLEASSYLTLRGGLELVHRSGWMAEALVYGAPTGGNDAFTITFGPMVQIRVGRIF